MRVGKVYLLYREGRNQGFYRVSTGPGQTYELTPLTKPEADALWATTGSTGQPQWEGIIEWRT